MYIPFSYFAECLFYAALGAAVVWPLLMLNVRIAPRLGLIDWPKARGVNEEQIPIIGHSLVLVSIGILLILMRYYPISPWFLTTAIIMAVMGYFDDRRPLSAVDKMFFQLVCATAVVFLDPQIHQALAYRYGHSGEMWGIFFLLGLMNAINFVDGIDGLAGLVIAVGCLGFIFLAQSFPGQSQYVIYTALLLGMTIPFLFINVVYRKGFLGNVGSYFISYVLAMIHLSLPINAAGPVSRLSISGLCFLLPVADAILVLLSRVFSLRSPFTADKGHLHHRLIQTSLPLRYILLAFGAIELSTAMVGYFFYRDIFLDRSILPIVFGLSQIGIVSMLILVCERASKRRVQVYFECLQSGQPIYFLKYQLTELDGRELRPYHLRRIEARICSEIRVTDLCFSQVPGTLFVTLRTLPEPLRGIASRLEKVFQAEKVKSTLVMEQGEFVKFSQSIAPAAPPPTPLLLVPHSPSSTSPRKIA